MSDYYSFGDVDIVIAPEGYPAYNINGQGIGTVGVDFEADNSIVDRAADGRTVTSKIKAGNGSVHFTVFQTSPLHKALKAMFNILYNADPAIWAATAITIAERSGANVILCTGVSFKKRSGQPYSAKAQEVTWEFLCADIKYQ